MYINGCLSCSDAVYRPTGTPSLRQFHPAIMVNTTISIIVLKSLSAILGLFVAYYVVEYLRSPLKQFNGPFWAKFTDWWRVVDTSRFKAHETQLRLHKKYGPVVRLGPNCLSISDPKLAKTIYAIRGSYYKVGIVVPLQ